MHSRGFTRTSGVLAVCLSQERHSDHEDAPEASQIAAGASTTGEFLSTRSIGAPMGIPNSSHITSGSFTNSPRATWIVTFNFLKCYSKEKSMSIRSPSWFDYSHECPWSLGSPWFHDRILWDWMLPHEQPVVTLGLGHPFYSSNISTSLNVHNEVHDCRFATMDNLSTFLDIHTPWHFMGSVSAFCEFWSL